MPLTILEYSDEEVAKLICEDASAELGRIVRPDEVQRMMHGYQIKTPEPKQPQKKPPVRSTAKTSKPPAKDVPHGQKGRPVRTRVRKT